MSTMEDTLNKKQEAPKLTEWAKEPDLKDLKEDFESARNAGREHLDLIEKWRDLRNVTGKYKIKARTGRSTVQPKVIRRQNEWRYAALTEPFLSSNKMFDVKPVTFEDAAGARQNGLVLNWQFRTKMNRVKFIDEYVRTTVDEGTSIVRIGWRREFQKIEVEVPIWQYVAPSTPEEAMTVQRLIMAVQGDPNVYDTLPEDAQKSYDYFKESNQLVIAEDTGETKTIQQDKLVWNCPTVELINPDNIYIDPSCGGDLDKARFVVMSFETSKGELKKDERYKNLDHINFEDNGILANTDHTTNTPGAFQFKDVLRKRIVAYEYWGMADINDDEQLVPIVATWVGNTLIRLEMNPFPDRKAPFVLVPYLPKARSLYGETDAELLEDNQRIIGAVTRGMIDLLARSANGQIGMQKGLLDIVNRRRYEAGQDYEFNPTGRPDTGIIEHKYPELPKSAFDMVMAQNQEAEAMTGVKAFSGGMSGNAYGDVAAGIRGMLDAASKREMAILRRLAHGMQEVGAKIIMMNQVFMSEEEIIRVTNTEFVPIKREDLYGQYDLEVDISTAEVDNAKAQDLAFMLQTMGPNMDFNVIKMILSEIADLKRMPELAEAIRQYEPKPTPIQQEELKKLQLENQKLERELNKVDSETELNKAKAREAASTADQKDLDFVEQETGTKHERDLQKQEAQSKGNRELAITHALLEKRKPDEKPGDLMAAIGWNKIADGKKPVGAIPNPANVANSTPFSASPFQRPGGVAPTRSSMPVGVNGVEPVLNLNSKYYDPRRDPTMNSGMNF